MDNREDPGQYYPGGSVVPARPEPAAHPVESVNGHAGNVVLNASDVGALPDTTAIPTADTVSGWGFLRKTWSNLTAAFASITHTHTKSNITDFAHGHSQSDVTGLTTALAGKQAELVSGTNIKTVNGQSLLGSGNVVIQSGTSAHASTHAAGGADEVTPASIGALASNGTAANSLKLGGIDASEYAQVDDVPTVVAPSSSAAEDAAAGAKATGEALATLSASVPTAVSQLTDAGDYLKKSGGTMTGGIKTTAADGAGLSVVVNATNIGYFAHGISRDKIDGQYTLIGGLSLQYPNKSGTIAVTSDIPSVPTKTSELTNDSGFVTADAIPVPTRVKNTDDTCRIDGEGNVYAVSKNTRGTPVATGYKAGTYTFASFNSGVSTKWICGSDANWLTYNLSTGYLYNGNVQVLLDKNIDLSVDGTKLTKDGVVVGTADNPIIIQGSSYTQSIIFYPQGEYSNETNNARLAREYPIKSLTVTSGAATALDSTINTITPTATTTIVPPTAKTIGARDWIVVVTQGATAYGVTFSGSFVAESGFSWPTMEASKTYVFSFTEVSANKFLAAVKEVANV